MKSNEISSGIVGIVALGGEARGRAIAQASLPAVRSGQCFVALSEPLNDMPQSLQAAHKSAMAEAMIEKMP